MRGRIFPIIWAALLASACLGCRPSSRNQTILQRHDLFNLSLGRLEDQLVVETLDQGINHKLRLAMRDGLFYIANGAGHKVLKFTSYGDLLSLIYDPEENPEPILLGKVATNQAFRQATAYVFHDLGEIAVGNSQDIYVEDSKPHVSAQANGFDKVVVHFDNKGNVVSYLGKEGVNGNPFPNITALSVTDSGELVVYTVESAGNRVYWFSNTSKLLYRIDIDQEKLPIPKGKRLIASLDKALNDYTGRRLYVKVDYYREVLDSVTKANSGVEYDSSLVWRLDPETGELSRPISVPSLSLKEEGDLGFQGFARTYEMLGVSRGRDLVFMLPEEGGEYQVMVINERSRNVKKYIIRCQSPNYVQSCFSLSGDAVLSTVLLDGDEARLSWWRLDRPISGTLP